MTHHTPAPRRLTRRRALTLLGVAIAAAAQDAHADPCKTMPEETTPMPDDTPPNAWQPIWIATGHQPDVYAAFRGSFTLDRKDTVSFDILGAHWYEVRIGGRFLTEGPYRFPLDHPEFSTHAVTLSAGVHVITATVRCEGVSTRLLRGDAIHPFFLCAASTENTLPISWKAKRLLGYRASGQRVNPQFGWIEWVDTRDNPELWHEVGFDDSAWAPPVAAPPPGGTPATWMPLPVRIADVRHLPVTPRPIGDGKLTGPFTHGDRPDWKTDTDLDWYARDLAPRGAATGVWRRYDLGQIRLGRPEVTFEVPAGTIIEIAYSEELRDGRVTPFIPLSAGLSRNLDHFVARGGRQTFAPLAPKGGRYLEIHVEAAPESVRFHDVAYTHRTYFGEPVGAFDSGDSRLDAIWKLGIATLRACAEDAVIDNPTRERGQWTGDALPSLHVASAGFNDLRIARRALEQSAYCARADGLIAGLCPGGDSHLSTYAAQWFSAVLEYHALTGDRSILTDLYPYAQRNLSAFEKALGPNGVRDSLGWGFVDWGYPGTPGTDSDIAVNLHILLGLRNLRRWTQTMHGDTARVDSLTGGVHAAVTAWLAPRIAADQWAEIGYHRTTLALSAGLIPADKSPAAIAYVKRHILSCFPNNPNAPRLANPDVHSAQLITPYFAHYAFPVLYAAGETDFVLDQYRECWGWGLDQGLTTQPEVFDLGWSHCHVWAASPTAQLSQYLLGLRPRFDLGSGHFELTLRPGAHPRASGILPFPGGNDPIKVRWEKDDSGHILIHVQTATPIEIHRVGEDTPFWRVASTAETRLAWEGGSWMLVR